LRISSKLNALLFWKEHNARRRRERRRRRRKEKVTTQDKKESVLFDHFCAENLTRF